MQQVSNIGLPYVKTENVDDAGNLPLTGQTLTGQADGSVLWA